MKRTLLIIAILMLVQLRVISQTKPDVYVTNKLADLTIIIQSNERGKAAQRLVPVLESKIVVQDSLLVLNYTRINNLNKIIDARDIQVKSLYQIITNDSILIANKNAVEIYQAAQIKSLNKSLKWQRVKTVFVGGTGAIIIGSLLYLLISK